MYICFNGIQQCGHLVIVLHTCNTPSSGEWKLTTVSGCIVPRSSFREGHVRALIANATVWDHSNYMLSGIENSWFHQMTDRKGNHISRNSMTLVLYWHLKDSGYASYKIKIHKVVMKHSLHLATEYIPPI